MNNLSLSRVIKLIKLELLFHKNFYLTVLIGALVLVTVVILLAWNLAKNSSGWYQKHYQVTYIFYFLGVLVFIVGQGFKDLRTKASSERYLLLPASHLEKLLSQVLIKLTLAVVIMPVIFYLGAILAKLIGFDLIKNPLSVEYFGKVELLKFESLWILTQMENLDFRFVFIGVILFIFSFMLLGSQYFGKWNFVYTPLLKISFVSIISYSSTSIFRWYKKGNIEIDELEVFDGVSLFVFVLILLLFFGSALSYVMSYYKLKEREV